MKKTLALMLACCLITGCSADPERYGSEKSYISSSVFSENSGSSELKPEGSSGIPASKPQSSTPSLSSTTASKPQSSTPSLSSTTASKPQSSMPSLSSTTASKPQSSTPSLSSTTASKPQSSTPSSSSTTASNPQSGTPTSSSITSDLPAEVAGAYGQRAPEQWEIEFADEVFRLTNIERKKAGLPEFERLSSLETAVNVRAWEVLVKYDHTRPDGRKFSTALTEAGIGWNACGENIAAGQRTPEEVVQGWMNSPGHRANILNPQYKYLAAGFYYDKDKVGGTNYGYFWVQNFCSTWD